MTKIGFIPGCYKTDNPWSHNDPWYPLTPEEFKLCPEGTVLRSIFGENKTVGTDYIDQDTRMGCIAFGVYKEQFEHLL